MDNTKILLAAKLSREVAPDISDRLGNGAEDVLRKLSSPVYMAHMAAQAAGPGFPTRQQVLTNLLDRLGGTRPAVTRGLPPVAGRRTAATSPTAAPAAAAGGR